MGGQINGQTFKLKSNLSVWRGYLMPKNQLFGYVAYALTNRHCMPLFKGYQQSTI